MICKEKVTRLLQEKILVITTYKLYFKLLYFLIYVKTQHRLLCNTVYQYISCQYYKAYTLDDQYLVLCKTRLLLEDSILYKRVCNYPYITGRFVFTVSGLFPDLCLVQPANGPQTCNWHNMQYVPICTCLIITVPCVLWQNVQVILHESNNNT